MATLFDDLVRITDPQVATDIKKVAVREFAERLRWTPSYEFNSGAYSELAADHVIVEHGLDNAAVITFLKSPYRTTDLDAAQVRSLLAISYNNLVEWHVFISQSDVRTINNLARGRLGEYADQVAPISPSDFETRVSPEGLSELFRTIPSQRALTACDDALIQVISRWKRLLKAEIPDLNIPSISALFNALIFARGCEDRLGLSKRDLLRVVSEQAGPTVDLVDGLQKGIAASDVTGDVNAFVDFAKLQPFTTLDKATALNLVRDFYAPREAPYEFDFALMSKHALSRIYERYVALLREEERDRDQLTFLAKVPIEEKTVKSGAIYTPQFIAGFFARFIRENTTARQFRALRVLDPACGSGIFLRTVMELQFNPFDPAINKSSIETIYSNSLGIDRDENAAQATKLSLALLYLVATGELPKTIPVIAAEAIEHLGQGTSVQQFDLILINPPYIKQEHLPAADVDLYRNFLGAEFKGRVDAYLAFVKLCLDRTETGGFSCFVLPQTFLNSDNGAALRSRISRQFDVRCLVDLSAIGVFEGVGAYSILLVVQRRFVEGKPEGPAQVCQATGVVGAALQAVLDQSNVETPYYSVFQTEQSFFAERDWTLVAPGFLPIAERLRSMPKLSSVARALQGFVSGADNVFIRSADAVQPTEREVYLRYLPDKEIGRFTVPSQTNQVVFFPYIGDRLIDDESILEKRFPETWSYLSSHKEFLASRRRSPGTPWWRPERPRSPDVMRRPKLVGPHLMLTSRFALDQDGSYVVSRSPFIIAREEADESQLLLLLTATLNSSPVSWFIRTNAPKYASGYNRLEIGLLNRIPIPNIAEIDPALLSKLLALSKKVVQKELTFEDDRLLDNLVMEAYGFSAQERDILRGTL